MAKKIGAIVSLSIIGILIIATIVMANININYGISTKTPNEIYVQFGSASAFRADAEQKSEIIDLIEFASQEKSLTAMFSGDLGKHAKITTKKSTLTPSSDNFYVRYSYNEAQTLKEGKSKFVDGDGKSYTYRDLIFEIKDVEGESKFTVYVIPDTNKKMAYTHYYTVDADFEKLFSYLDQEF